MKPPASPLTPKARERTRALRRDMTDAERKLWSALRRKGVHGARFRRQYPLADYVVDFCCVEHKLIIEWMVASMRSRPHTMRGAPDCLKRKASESCASGTTRLTNLEGVLEVIEKSLPPS